MKNFLTEYKNIKQIEKKTLLALFILISLIIVSLFVYAIFDGEFFITHEDETTYYNSAKLFYETNSVKAVSCISEDVSSILQTAWYGPAYHVFYGGIAKIVGFNNYYFVIIHFFLLIASLLVVFRIELETKQKLYICIALLTTDVIIKNIFTYYPEMLHIFFAVVLTFILIKLQEGRFYKKYLILFISFVLFFTIFRVTSIFWLVAILAFAKNKKQLFVNSMIILSGILLAIIYMKFFNAPAWAAGLKSFGYLYEFKIGYLIKAITYNFIKNLYLLFRQSSITIFVLLFLYILTFYSLLKNKTRILFATFTVATLSFITLFLFYTTNSFFFEKQTAFLFPALIIVNIRETKMNNVILIIFFSFLPFSLLKSVNTVRAKKNAYYTYTQEQNIVSQFKQVSNFVKKDKINYILWQYSEHKYSKTIPIAFIPLTNPNKYPILWTTNICNNKTPDSIKFKRFGKLKIDYILSKNKLKLDSIDLIDSTDYFYFYAIKNK